MKNLLSIRKKIISFLKNKKWYLIFKLLFLVFAIFLISKYASLLENLYNNYYYFCDGTPVCELSNTDLKNCPNDKIKLINDCHPLKGDLVGVLKIALKGLLFYSAQLVTTYLIFYLFVFIIFKKEIIKQE